MINNIPNLQRIFNILPQRYPFLMVDRVIKADKKEMITLKNVTNNEPHFQGHFPGNNPIMPGVLILEAMIQTSNLLAAYMAENANIEEYISYVTTIDKVKFRKPVIPGDQLYLKVSLLNKIGAAWRFVGKADVNGVLVAEATWMGVLTKEPSNKENNAS